MKNEELFSKWQAAVAVLLILLLWWGASYKLIYLKAQAHLSMSEKNLRRLTDAITVYRGDNQGICPEKLEDLLRDHMDKIPPAYDGKGGKSAAVKDGSYAESLDGKGGWIYDNVPTDEEYCKVFANIL